MEDSIPKNYKYFIEIHLIDGKIIIDYAQVNHLNSKIQEIKKKYFTEIKEIRIK